MAEITVVDVKPQLVLGMRKTGPYQEIATMIGKSFQFAVSRNIAVTGAPMFICHEETLEEAIEADKE